MKKILTVFTPSFNRAYCLHNVYNSLLRQTSGDFKWLVIDDGSTDNTANLVNDWIKENKIQIQYIHQQNKGMLGAHNTAYDNIDTLLNVCIDSDDYMTDNAVQIIIDKWTKYGGAKHAGLLGLDVNPEGKVLGIEFKHDLSSVKFTDLKKQYGDIGDKKFVLRTEIINKFPRFPEIKNEKFPAAGLLYRMIDTQYDLLAINEKLCVVEYLPDGNSKNKFSQYKKNPNAFVFYRIERMKLAIDFKDKFQNAIHYVSSCIFANRFNILKEVPNKAIIILALPFGIALNIYLRNTKKKGIK